MTAVASYGGAVVTASLTAGLVTAGLMTTVPS